MKSSVSLIALAFCALTALAQSTSTAPTTSPAPSASGLQPRGPEAVAKVDPNKIVATINGKQITAKEAADLISSLPAQDRKRYEGNLAQLVQQIFTEDQIAAEALKQNLDQKPPYKQQLLLSRDNILAQAYLHSLTESPTAAANAKQYYDAHSADFDQVKVSGILVAFNQPGTPANSAASTRSEPDAQAKALDLEKRIKAGGDFAALARTESDQQSSASKGGDMGSFVMADQNVPSDIKDTLAKLQPGQVSEPIRAGGGFFILKLDTRTRLAFDQVKPSLVQKMELDKYKIHVEDQNFFSAAAPPPSLNLPSLARPNPPAGQTAPATAPKPPTQ